MPHDFQLTAKQNFWNSNYNKGGFQTQITRLRTGNSLADFT
jgi:hypothetical protein